MGHKVLDLREFGHADGVQEIDDLLVLIVA